MYHWGQWYLDREARSAPAVPPPGERWCRRRDGQRSGLRSQGRRQQRSMQRRRGHHVALTRGVGEQEAHSQPEQWLGWAPPRWGRAERRLACGYRGGPRESAKDQYGPILQQVCPRNVALVRRMGAGGVAPRAVGGWCRQTTRSSDAGCSTPGGRPSSRWCRWLCDSGGLAMVRQRQSSRFGGGLRCGRLRGG